MLSAALAWLASKGVGIVVGAVMKMLLDAWNSYQSNQAHRDAGRAEAEHAQAAEALVVQEALTKDAAEVVTEDEALSRMEEGRG